MNDLRNEMLRTTMILMLCRLRAPLKRHNLTIYREGERRKPMKGEQ